MPADRIRHDLKNQLGIIIGFSELLLADAAPGDRKRGDLEEIHRAAVAGLNLLSNLFPGDAEDASRATPR